MPRVVVPAVKASKSGINFTTPVTGDATNNHYYNNSGKTLLVAKNTNGASTARTVTILVTGTVDGNPATKAPISIPAGQEWVLGPYDVSNYGSQVSVNVEHAEVTLRALEP